MKTNICLNGLNECVAPTELYDNNAISLLGQYNVGSTQPLIRQSDVKEIKIIIKKEELHTSFEEQSELYFDKINKNKTQIRTLEKLRDTLLPKLMSGEVRVQSRRDKTFVKKTETTTKTSSVGAAQKTDHHG